MSKPMTYAEARAEILTRIPPDTSFCIQVACWYHRDGNENFEFSIWDSEEHHRGETIEASLEKFKGKFPPLKKPESSLAQAQTEVESVFSATPAEVTAN